MEQRAVAPHDDLDARQLVEQIGVLLARRGHTLAVGETSAGGALASLIHVVPLSESWFRGGIVLYAGRDVPLAQSIRGVASFHGVVSEEYVAALAGLVQRTFACEWALAESGIAGPQIGRRSAKPVGMVCLAVAGPKPSRNFTQARGTSLRATADMLVGEEPVWATTRVLVDSGRNANQRQFAVEALRLCLHVLEAYVGE